MRAADAPPVADQIPDSTKSDMSWIDIAVLGQKRGVVIVDYAPGWSDFIDELHFADAFENEEPDHLDPGVYRWSGFTVGSWHEGDLCVVKGGTFTRAAPPAMDREAVEAGGYMLVPSVATREMVNAADACTDAYSAYAAMVQTVGKKPIFAADVLTEQWLADVLQDTLEMDWNTTDGARGIVRALKNGLVTFPQSGGQIATASQITITPDLITLVKRLVVAGRTTGGTAGPDVGLMQALDDVERALSTLSADAIRKGEGELAREEAAHLVTIDQRDAAEAALSDAYRAVCGCEPAWSNNFSYEDAVREMREAATPASHASDGGK